MELADMRDLGSRAARRAGSTPVTRTRKGALKKVNRQCRGRRPRRPVRYRPKSSKQPPAKTYYCTNLPGANTGFELFSARPPGRRPLRYSRTIMRKVDFATRRFGLNGAQDSLNDIARVIKDRLKKPVLYCSESAFADACCPGNPRDTSVEEIAALYRSLM